MDDENVELPWEYSGEMYHVSKPVNRMLRLNLLLLLGELGGKSLDFLLHVSWNMMAVAMQLSGFHPSFSDEAGVDLLGGSC